MEEATYIYALLDPETKDTRYVGKSNNPQQRLLEHIRESFVSQTYKCKWVSKLVREGKLPELLILDKVSKDCWSFWEIFYYKFYIELGCKLTNSCYPGGGVTKQSEEMLEKIRKPIIQICNDTNKIINEFKDRQHASEVLNINIKRLDEILSGYKNYGNGVIKKLKTYKNTIIMRKVNYDINKDYRVKAYRSLEVNKYDLNNNFIESYLSLKDAALKNNVSPSGINAVLKNRQLSSAGFIWKYKNI